jgi:3-hydroxyacyl-CoA dehydrogenase
MSQLVQFTKDNDIGIVTINNPPVNALSPGVPEGISDAIDQIAKDDGVKAVVIIGAGRTFIGGADIKEFGKMTSGMTERGDGLLSLLLKIEDCPKPVVMAIQGVAYGGGLEVAMAGHYRVATRSAQVGQPEVKLGIIPGAAGSQRLPRLAGVAKAVEMCAEGNPVKAEEALAQLRSPARSHLSVHRKLASATTSSAPSSRTPQSLPPRVRMPARNTAT